MPLHRVRFCITAPGNCITHPSSIGPGGDVGRVPSSAGQPSGGSPTRQGSGLRGAVIARSRVVVGMPQIGSCGVFGGLRWLLRRPLAGLPKG